ncbi:MAG: Ig-like domain-containing protein [Muribaculaceae bacterium]|nr:Ig-like domain-containing protein [Muribaculaceae bacterium]
MKPIRLIISMVALLTCWSAALAALDFPSVPAYTPGKSSALTVGASTPAGTSALQFTVTLPDGFSLTSTTVTLDKSRATDHTYRMNKISDTSYKCVIYSNSNTPFASGSGSLFSLPLKAAASAKKGNYALKFTEIASSDAAGRETAMPDVAVDLPVVILASSVSIIPSSVSVNVGEEVRLNAEVTPAEADQTVVWKLYNTSAGNYVSISEDGVVRGLARGSARVTATTVDGTGRTASCTVTVKDVKVTALTLNRESMELRPGATVRLFAAVAPDNATDKNVTWSSSAPGVVTVDSDGYVTAKTQGTAVVTATAADGSGVKAECRVTVLAPLVSSLTLSDTELSLRVRDTARLTATVGPSGASQQLTWSSSDPAVVSVDGTGNLTALSEGNAVIRVSATDGSGIEAECRVAVAAALVSSVTLNRSSLGLRLGESELLSATVLPDYAGNRAVVWSSSDEAVATVDQSGRIEAVAPGTATVTATAADGSGVSGKCVVTVSRQLASKVTISQTELTVRVYDSARLSATVSPADALQSVDWSSSAPGVVEVDSDGSVTAKTQGSAVVTATAADGSGVKAECRVTVLAPLVSSLTLSDTELSLRVRDTARLTATVGPSGASQQLTWSSSDPAVVSVDGAGNLTALSEGNAVIRVSATDGSGIEAECRVAVAAALVSSVTLNRTSVYMSPGEFMRLSVTVLPDYAGSRAVVWSSSDEAVATVDQSGLIEAVAPGAATVTATSADGTAISDYCQVNVEHGSAIVSAEDAGQEVSVTVDGRDIIVDGVPADDLVRVVNSSGLMVYSGRGTRVGGLSAGFHLVIVGSRAYKVILR